MWTDICYKCGKKIFNEIPDGKDVMEFKKEMEKKGYIVGYKTDYVGYYNTIEKKIKPICSECSSKEIQQKNKKDAKKGLKKITSKLEKKYICPLCDGYIENIFVSTDKKIIIEHLLKEHERVLINLYM